MPLHFQYVVELYDIVIYYIFPQYYLLIHHQELLSHLPKEKNGLKPYLNTYLLDTLVIPVVVVPPGIKLVAVIIALAGETVISTDALLEELDITLI